MEQSNPNEIYNMYKNSYWCLYLITQTRIFGRSSLKDIPPAERLSAGWMTTQQAGWLLSRLGDLSAGWTTNAQAEWPNSAGWKHRRIVNPIPPDNPYTLLYVRRSVGRLKDQYERSLAVWQTGVLCSPSEIFTAISPRIGYIELKPATFLSKDRNNKEK